MGRRGPAPKPTSLRLLHGDRSSRINHAEPQPLDVPIVRPDWLSPVAAAEWDRLAPHLASMGTVKATDEPLLAAYCESYARWRRLADLAAHSNPILNRGSDVEPIWVKNPIFAQVRDATAELRVLAREFGLTPSARAGLRVTVVSAAPVERLFTGSG
jgi:P27 family predicted phage terminase small subunit